jgi:uncharacterized membrane protein YciS (DUF1049 family)
MKLLFIYKTNIIIVQQLKLNNIVFINVVKFVISKVIYLKVKLKTINIKLKLKQIKQKTSMKRTRMEEIK